MCQNSYSLGRLLFGGEELRLFWGGGASPLPPSLGETLPITIDLF